MIDSRKPPLADMPAIASLDELYSIANVLGHNTIRVCERLAIEMKACRNDETARVFEDLVELEVAHVHSIRKRAENVGAKAGVDIDDIWRAQDLRGDLAREIADNPYLMTPYRALRLAVINKERVFEILSALAANQDDNVIGRHAELLAEGQLSEIAELRLRRRRASRSEISTAIEKAGLDTPPVGMDTFNRSVRTVHAIVRTMTLIVRDSWASQMTGETEQILQGLLEDFRDFPDELVADEDRAALETRVRQTNDNLFSALKTLLRELESAADLFLGYAENTHSEDVVHAAQTKAERYIRRIVKIRDELNLRVPEESAWARRCPNPGQGIASSSRRVRDCGRPYPSIEHNLGEKERHHPVGLVDDLADAQVGTGTAQHVGLGAREAMQTAQQVDHSAHRVPGTLHQIGPDAGRDMIPLAVEVPRNRTGSLVTWEAKLRAFYQIEGERYAHRAFDRRAADLPIPLGGMGVAHREQRAGDLDRKIKLGAGAEVADVHVAADPPWRNDTVQPGLARCETDGAAKGFQRHLSAGAIGRRGEPLRVVAPDVERRFRELVGQQAEAGDDRGPAPTRRNKGFDCHLERVAGFGPVDGDRAGDRVDLVEVERRDLRDA